MVQVTYNIELKGGVVTMLFTPRLYAFKGTEGVTFEFIENDPASVHSLYADIMYCAALNHWTLTHDGDKEFPYRRIDFHEFSGADRKAFGNAMSHAIQALSGKSIGELISEAKAKKETIAETSTVKKKNLFGWITNLLKHS